MDATDADALFAEAEVRAERVVALVRISVSTLLAAALALAVFQAQPAIDAMMARAIRLAETVIAAYFVLGLVSLAATRGRLYRPWMSWLFVTLDVGVIAISVALSLDNFQMPAKHAPSMPAVWLAPLVLCFGALRYNPALQTYVLALLLGGLAVGALAGGTWIDSPASPPPGALGVLFGVPPNLMRLVMVAIAGLVLVVAVARTRRLLVRTIDEMGRRATLTRYLPPQVADWLFRTSTEEVRTGRRQAVAVMFADIRGFTERAETMNPVALGHFVTEFRRCVTQAAGETGGVIDKFVGDCAMVLFGVPEPGPEDARHALDCALGILDNVKRWNRSCTAPEWGRVEVGIGVHWGDVFCGAVGDETRLEYTVLGDAVNVAARLEEESKAVGLPLIVSKELLEAAGDCCAEVNWTALPPRRLRGRHEETVLFGMAAEA